MILDCAEDYRKIIVNAKHELILTRSRTDLNAIMQNVQENPEEFKILLNKVKWKVPYLFSYYGKEPEPLLTKETFKKYAPIIVIDCSKQNEFLKQASVDVRLEFESSTNSPANTATYCLILHDRIVQYKPISGAVKKIILV